MKRVLAIVLCLAMCLGLLAVTASAADGTKVYLKPNDNWKIDGARFAVYCFGNGEKWIDMTASSTDGLYEATIPAGYPNIIFCRMNPGTTANNWSNKWNQTADLTVPTDNKICCNITGWDKSSQWTELDGDVAPVETHYVVAGDASLVGVNWSTAANDKNKMTKKSDNLYELVLPDVAVGEYNFKVVENTQSGSTWFGIWGVNYWIKTTTTCDVTITFNVETKEITASGTGLEVAKFEMATVHFKLPQGADAASLYGWGDGYDYPLGAWSGTKMNASQEHDGWVTLEVFHKIPNFILNGNGFESVSFELEEAKEYWIELGATNAEGKYEVSFVSEPEEDTDEDEDPAPTPENFTVNVQVPEDWTTVNIYACDANWNYLTGPWPGNAATKGDDGWYTLTVAGDVKYVIVNNGTEQTIDIPVTAEKEVWIQVGEKIADGLEGAGKFDGKVVEKPAEPAETGDAFDMIAVSALMIGAVIGLSGTILNKKKFF